MLWCVQIAPVPWLLVLNPRPIRNRYSERPGLRALAPRSEPTRARQTPRAALVDSDNKLIRPGDIVDVHITDWSLGVAKWMEHAKGRVIAVGRTRVKVQFEGSQGTHSLPPLVMRVDWESDGLKP